MIFERAALRIETDLASLPDSWKRRIFHQGPLTSAEGSDFGQDRLAGQVTVDQEAHDWPEGDCEREVEFLAPSEMKDFMHHCRFAAAVVSGCLLVTGSCVWT